MRVGVIGTGAVGRRTGRELVARPEVDAVVVVSTREREASRLASSLGPTSSSVAIGTWSAELAANAVQAAGLDVVVLCLPDELQVDLARVMLAIGVDVVSLADSAASVGALLASDDQARETGRRLVVGTGLAPGWSTLLAAHAVALVDEVDEVAVAVTGSAGPACVERRAQAVRSDTQEWRDGTWVECAARSGPELVWFPEPVGAVDCTRGDAGDALLLHRAWPSAGQIVIKLARPEVRPLPRQVRWRRREEEPRELAAVRVAVSGRAEGQPFTVVYGLCSPAAAASGVLSALSVAALAPGSELSAPGAAPGAGSVIDVLAPVPALRAAAARGVRGLVYDAID